MKKALAGLAVFLAAAYVVALPYITVYQIRQAVEMRDSVALSEHIDFPSVRLSLKEQLNAALMDKMQSDEMKDNPFAALGMMLAGPLVDKVLEAYVTPAGIGKLLSGEKPSVKNAKKIRSETESVASNTTSTGEQTTEEKPLAEVSLGYKTSSRFEVEDKKKGVRVVLRRTGLTWKVTDILFTELSGGNPPSP